MRLFDSHCHLDVDAFDGIDGVDAAVERAQAGDAADVVRTPRQRQDLLARSDIGCAETLGGGVAREALGDGVRVHLAAVLGVEHLAREGHEDPRRDRGIDQEDHEEPEIEAARCDEMR